MRNSFHENILEEPKDINSSSFHRSYILWDTSFESNHKCLIMQI